jgi:hypothetical protein
MGGFVVSAKEDRIHHVEGRRGVFELLQDNAAVNVAEQRVIVFGFVGESPIVNKDVRPLLAPLRLVSHTNRWCCLLDRQCINRIDGESRPLVQA